MGLIVGDAACTEGLALRLYTTRLATLSLPGSGAIRDAAVAALKADCYAIAQAVVAEITANAEVSVVVSEGGLQISGLTGDPTAAPESPVTLTGTVG